MGRISQNLERVAIAGARGYLRLERRNNTTLAEWLAFKLGISASTAETLAARAETELRAKGEWTP